MKEGPEEHVTVVGDRQEDDVVEALQVELRDDQAAEKVDKEVANHAISLIVFELRAYIREKRQGGRREGTHQKARTWALSRSAKADQSQSQRST